jgi:hypothetical protein
MFNNNNWLRFDSFSRMHRNNHIHHLSDNNLVIVIHILPSIFQAICGAIDLDSDVDLYGIDEAGYVHAMDFVKDLIVTPPMNCGKAEIESDAHATVMMWYCVMSLTLSGIVIWNNK